MPCCTEGQHHCYLVSEAVGPLDTAAEVAWLKMLQAATKPSATASSAVERKAQALSNTPATCINTSSMTKMITRWRKVCSRLATVDERLCDSSKVLMTRCH